MNGITVDRKSYKRRTKSSAVNVKIMKTYLQRVRSVESMLEVLDVTFSTQLLLQNIRLALVTLINETYNHVLAFKYLSYCHLICFYRFSLKTYQMFRILIDNYLRFVQ